MRAFARASEVMTRQGFEAPILVGGAAAELYSASAITTGHLDIVTGRQAAFEEALREDGFVCPAGAGQSLRGWVHPDLGLGFEVVSATLLDGRADRERVQLIDMGTDGDAAVISVEDMIADRMGQYASGAAPEMLEQARILFSLHQDSDRDYLERRIREETLGEFGVIDLEAAQGEV